MANDENLEKGKATQFKSGDEAARNGQKGGVSSGRSRRKKADMRKAVQNLLDGTYNDDDGKTFSGAELMAVKLFEIATNKNDKQCIAAMKLILELTGQDKDALTDKKTKTEIKLLETKIKALSGLDDGETKKLLDSLNKVLSDVDSVIE